MNNKQSLLDMIATVVKYVLIVLVLLFFISLSRQAYEIGYSIFSESALAPEGQGTTISVEVTPEMSVRRIGKMLEEKGLIADGDIFVFQEMFSAYHGELTPGIYDLSTEMTPSEMMAVMAAGHDEYQAAQEAASGDSGEEAGDGESAAQETSGAEASS